MKPLQPEDVDRRIRPFWFDALGNLILYPPVYVLIMWVMDVPVKEALPLLPVFLIFSLAVLRAVNAWRRIQAKRIIELVKGNKQ